MKKIGTYALLVLSVIFWGVSAHAELIDRGNNLIYDTDLNITWYDYSVGGTWESAMSWASGLNVGGTSGWGLPQTLPMNGVSYNYAVSRDGSTDYGYNITNRSSEMAYLFYVELGNKGYFLPDGIYQYGYGLMNTGPFSPSTITEAVYWSGTEYGQGPDCSWNFGFNFGFQGYAPKESYLHVLAVHSGDVGAPVPEPSTFLLLGSGLIGLAGYARKKFFKKEINL